MKNKLFRPITALLLCSVLLVQTGCSGGQSSTGESENKSQISSAAKQATSATKQSTSAAEQSTSGTEQAASTAEQATKILGDFDNTGLAADRAKKQNTDPASCDIFAMDTYMTLTAYGDRAYEALEAASAEIKRLDELLSVGNSESEIYAINSQGQGKISEDTEVMLETSMRLFAETEGAFDITIYPLMVEWGFTSGEFHVPAQEKIEELLADMGSNKLTFEEGSRTLTLSKGQGIDFGAIAKGYTSARIMEIYAEYDLVCGLVSLGGNVQCYSNKANGNPWKCAIRLPEEGEGYLGVVSVIDKAVITSGGYERYFTDEESGKTYHHIIDPATGYSAENGLLSVTIVSDDGMVADGLSTAVFVMGLTKAEAFWRSHSDEFDMILMTQDGQIYVTEGLKASFQSDFSWSLIEQ